MCMFLRNAGHDVNDYELAHIRMVIDACQECATRTASNAWEQMIQEVHGCPSQDQVDELHAQYELAQELYFNSLLPSSMSASRPSGSASEAPERKLQARDGEFYTRAEFIEHRKLGKERWTEAYDHHWTAWRKHYPKYLEGSAFFASGGFSRGNIGLEVQCQELL